MNSLKTKSVLIASLKLNRELISTFVHNAAHLIIKNAGMKITDVLLTAAEIILRLKRKSVSVIRLKWMLEITLLKK